jgi:hypothetical protein
MALENMLKLLEHLNQYNQTTRRKVLNLCSRQAGDLVIEGLIKEDQIFEDFHN